jgi:hypothetical protein
VPTTPIVPVSPDEMCRAVVTLMDAWWGIMPVDVAGHGTAGIGLGDGREHRLLAAIPCISTRIKSAIEVRLHMGYLRRCGASSERSGAPSRSDAVLAWCQ